MKFYLNGTEKEYNGNPELLLINYLRDTEGLISVKDGCSPQAACGCCTIEIDGRAMLSCAIPMKKIEGKSITTVEGLDEYKQRVFANAFMVKSGVQCGFCTPGILMKAKVLIDKNPDPTWQEIEKELTPNLCRCTGYKKIVESILYAAEAMREVKEIPLPVSSGKVGERYPKYNAENLTLGKFPFVADIKLDGMLYGALKFSDHPRAKVLSINTAKAEQLEGVIRVFTSKDIPGNRFTGLIKKDWPLFIEEGEETRYVGDVLAGVVAESEETARKAAGLIEIQYEVLEPVTDPFIALQAGSPQIHPEGNLLSSTKVKRGDADEAEKKSAYTVHGLYQTQVIEHAFLEPECAVARPDDDGIEVLSQGQGVYEDRNQISSLLNLPLEKVRIIQVPNGGAFGGKEDLSIQGHTALFSYLLKKPVKILLNRDESILMHPKRHPFVMDYSVGCDENGTLTYLKADIIGDTGAYASVGMKVLERGAGHATGAYHVPNVEVESKAVYTNNLPCGAMRGFGVNQVTFAVESCIDELCEKGGFDKWEFRYRNALSEGKMTATGQIIEKGCGVKETLEAVKDIYYSSKYAGIACGIKNTGIGNGMNDEGKVKIEIVSANKVKLHHGWTEMGQGVNTMAVQFLCNETNIAPSIIDVIVDTSAEAYSGMTTASRATSIIGNSIKVAAQELREDLKSKTLEELSGKTYEGQWVCDWTTKPGKTQKEITHYSYSYATQVITLNDDGEIDTVYAAHDAGKIINPSLYEGQIEGSVHMGLGYALTEDLVLEKGIPASTRLRKCGVLRAKEMPKIVVIPVEVEDPYGPYGAKGVGEIGLVPTAAAVSNAFYEYDKNRYYKLPIKTRTKKLSFETNPEIRQDVKL